MSSQSINHRVSGVRRSGRGPCGARGPGSHRRATVLVFVLALLGILFVMGVSFVALTQFESKSIRSERQRSLGQRGADGLFQELGQALQEGIGGPFALNGADRERIAFAELPGVHTTFSPIEPYWVGNPPAQRLLFKWLTDLEGRANGDLIGADLRALLPDGLDTDFQNAVPEFPNGRRILPADADGDGVVDSLAVNVSKLKLFSKSQMSVLAPALNAQSNPAGAVYLAVRIVPHGGLVNINDAHPRLIMEALNVNDLTGVDPVDPKGTIRHRPTVDHIGYAPALEEVALRRRNLLPSRSLAPSALVGNPFLDRDTSPYGGADMYTILMSPRPPSETLRYQTVYEDDHRYWPMDPSEPFKSSDPDGASIWSVRMEPRSSWEQDSTFDEYDQRHLVTTVSHDDLLARGVDVAISDGNPSPRVARRDLLDMMATDNFIGWSRNPDECRTGENAPPGSTDYTNSSWFELPDYPHTLPDGYDKNGNPMDWCDCVDPQSECRLNARKGRLRLSLPWLDQALDPNTGVFPGRSGLERAHRLVQEVFTMLLLNARNTSVAAGATEIWGHEQIIDPQKPEQTFWVPSAEAVSVAAASLTANLFDYMDIDDAPTRILLRSSAFDPPACSPANPCDQDAGEGVCQADGFCERNPQAGKPLVDQSDAKRYVYGIEAQPYITEIATVTAGLDPGPPPGFSEGEIVGFGIELYNPYPNAIELDTHSYSIVSLDPSQSTIDSVWGNDANRVQLQGPALPNEFTVLRGGPSNLLPQPGRGVYRLERNNANVPANFIRTGYHVYLVREVNYGTEQNPDVRRIVVDEFAIEGNQIGVDRTSDPPAESEIWSTERSNVAQVEDMSQPVGPWFAPVPALSLQGKNNVPFGSLGEDNITIDPDTAMVEAPVANAGSFARAFPTTGSMLMLMRHANLATSDYKFNNSQPSDPLKDLAFTAHLDDVVQVAQGCPPSVTPVSTRNEVDNGRMPVFDFGGAHRRAACNTAQDKPGDLDTLPWGQLVFDYFTALPLSNLGPYAFNGESGGGACCTGSTCFDASGESECMDAGGIFAGPGTVCGEVACGVLRDQPKVDLDGLRVHGRINVNAAPWKVLAGLPMVRDAAFDFLPPDSRGKVVNTLSLGSVAKPIGEPLAKAIVAYRELRELRGLSGGVTGNYNVTRGWKQPAPSQRRGTGLMSVGELADVRNSSGDPNFQIFPDGLNFGKKDFVRYASRLLAMGDWMTVRSHVFTVYGLLLGDEDQTIEVPGDETETQRLRTEDVLSRAVRFQETLDRLPTFTGEPLPRRIGERVLVGYTDTQND